MAVATLGLCMCGSSIWLLVSTIELAEKGLAHNFSRSPGMFSASVAPETARLSYFFHLGLGCLLLAFGLILLVLPFTTKARRWSYPQQELASWSGRGVLKLLGWFVLMFVLIWVWKSFVG